MCFINSKGGYMTLLHLSYCKTTLSIGFAFALLACGGGGTGQTSDTSAETRDSAQAVKTTASVVQPTNTTGRLLASNCFQCHGTLGLGGFEKIRGSSASEALEFMTKPANSNIMAAHAQGYTRAQLQTIIAYLKQ